MTTRRRRHLALTAVGAILATASLVTFLYLGATGLYTAGRQTLEPFSAGEERCRDVDPE